MEPRLRSVLIAVVVAAGLVATALLLKNRPDAPATPEANQAQPAGGRDAAPGTAAAGAPEAVGGDAPATQGALAGSQREETALPKRPEKIGGMTPAEIADYARTMLALDAKSRSTGTGIPAEQGAEHAAWTEQMAIKYADVDAEQAVVHVRNLEAILHWQINGPFLSDEEVLPKELLEMYVRELEWLRER